MVMVSQPPLANTVTLGEQDFSGKRDFYRRLGWPAVFGSDGFTAFQLRGAVLALFQLGQLARDAHAQAGPISAGIRSAVMITVDRPGEVDELARRPAGLVYALPIVAAADLGAPSGAGHMPPAPASYRQVTIASVSDNEVTFERLIGQIAGKGCRAGGDSSGPVRAFRSCQTAPDWPSRRGDHGCSRAFDPRSERTGCGPVLLDVWCPLAYRPDGGRWRQRLRRCALVLPRHARLHPTLDLTLGKAG
jgi:hypothetical protein